MSLLAQIADEAGVSVATVSLVANDKGSISDATRRRVKELLDQHKFQPRSRRRGRRDKSSRSGAAPVDQLGTVCVVCPRLSSNADEPAGVYNYWTQALQQEVLKHNGNFSCLTGQLKARDNLNYRQGLADGLFQGVILVGVEDGDGYVETALKHRVPLVVLNRKPDHGEFSSVGPDNFDGGRQAAEHLIESGHERIGLITTRSSSITSHFIEARQAGFKFGLKSHSLEPACRLEYSPEEPGKTMDVITRKVLESGATAVFFCTDIQAITFINELERTGRQVPQDLSVVGFDNADLKSESGLRLTTIAHESRSIAARSIEMLEKIIDQNGQAATTELVPVTLMKGDTTTPYQAD